ncbi:hypothetical protein SBA4_50013 [Candidatus Sulfopaludibacter sp. SbA4]|nr:hypothetical protein SBA4_50013 [Candidatus Sulfopaludibacter sp. SbA4]
MTLGEHAILWSPNVANGTSGSAVAFLDLPGSEAGTINNFGQVIGPLGGSCYPVDFGVQTCFYPGTFLWTPSSPNATSGTIIYPNAWGATTINDSGQSIGTQLFTPSVPNGSTGSLTTIDGLPMDGPLGGVYPSPYLLAINNTGTVAGKSTVCFPNPCAYHGFLWTPFTPNGTAGSTAEIPIPLGFVALVPSALNASGQVVGQMTRAGWGLAAVPLPERNGLRPRNHKQRPGWGHPRGHQRPQPNCDQRQWLGVSPHASASGRCGSKSGVGIGIQPDNGIYFLRPSRLAGPRRSQYPHQQLPGWPSVLLPRLQPAVE